ncbi:MAG: dicarboxylate/amino acid:cation symporter [Xanthomonadales bacterium]|nr:dicarboxylate/amino acid:cation symporter [Xanthomonadales bacterium]
MSLSGKDLTRQILIGMVVGFIVGLLINLAFGDVAWVQANLVDGLFDAVGKIFLNMLKMLIVPLVFVSLVCGTASLSDPSRLGRLGGKTLLLYLATTAIAVSSALFFANIFDPGEGSNFPEAQFEAVEAPSIKDVFVNMVPSNPIQAMAETNMLQLIFFSIIFGLAITLAGKPGARIKAIFDDANEVIMQIVVIVMKLAPYGVFALLAKIVAQLGWNSFQLLLDYFLLVLAVLFFHALVVYPTLLKLLGRKDPVMFMRKMWPVQIFAFSTASSNATIPVTLRTVEKRLGADNAVASFTVPLGATINMDGTAIMQGIATVFIANVYGVDLTLAQMLTVVLMATMASIGTAGVPGVGLILLATVLTQVGLPIEGIGLILGIDRILDMTRTAVNITGDAAVTTIVAVSEGDLDHEVFDDPDAGSDVPTEIKPPKEPAEETG